MVQNIGCNVAFVVAAIGKGVEKIVTAEQGRKGLSLNIQVFQGSIIKLFHCGVF